MHHKPADPTPKLTALTQAEPDLIDRIFDLALVALVDDPGAAAKVRQQKPVARKEFKGEIFYSSHRSARERRELFNEALKLFNGRNVAEVARRLQISRATVYRAIKQPGDIKPVQKNSLKIPELETTKGLPCQPTRHQTNS